VRIQAHRTLWVPFFRCVLFGSIVTLLAAVGWSLCSFFLFFVFTSAQLVRPPSCFLARCFCLFARSLCPPVYLFALPALRLRSCFAFRPLCSHSLICFPVLFSRGKRFLCEWPSAIIAVVGGRASFPSRVVSASELRRGRGPYPFSVSVSV
jgi:hypothetical protein